MGFINPQRQQFPGGRPMPEERKMVAMTLHWLGNETAYKHIAMSFGVSEHCFINCTEYIVQLLIEKAGEMIKWPSKQDLP